MTIGGGNIEQVATIEMKHVEHEDCERNRRPERLDIKTAARAGGGLLKRSRPTALVESDGFAIKHNECGRRGRAPPRPARVLGR